MALHFQCTPIPRSEPFHPESPPGPASFSTCRPRGLVRLTTFSGEKLGKTRGARYPPRDTAGKFARQDSKEIPSLGECRSPPLEQCGRFPTKSRHAAADVWSWEKSRRSLSGAVRTVDSQKATFRTTVRKAENSSDRLHPPPDYHRGCQHSRCGQE